MLWFKKKKHIKEREEYSYCIGGKGWIEIPTIGNFGCPSCGKKMCVWRDGVLYLAFCIDCRKYWVLQ